MTSTRTTYLALFLAVALAAPTLSFAQEEGGAAQGGAPADGPGKRERMSKLFRIIQAEPTIKDTQRAAVKFYKLEMGRIHDMAGNARLKGLLPELEASVDNMVGDTFTNTRDGLYPILPNPNENPNPGFFKERTTSSTDQFTWRVRATWALDRLIFNAEALDTKSLGSLQESLVREITTLFFARRRLLASLILSPPQDEEEYFYEAMRLEELTATLDVLTGGMFGAKAYQVQGMP